MSGNDPQDDPVGKFDPARLTPGERYQRDAEFHALVETIRAALAGGRYTPTELREAVILAATLHEQTTLRSWFIEDRDVASFLRRQQDAPGGSGNMSEHTRAPSTAEGRTE